VDEILNQINFDLLACRYLKQIDAAITPPNIAKAREIFKNDSDALLDTILSIDEVRKASGKDYIVSVTKIKRRKKKAA